jgi:hypothetical protein
MRFEDAVALTHFAAADAQNQQQHERGLDANA